MNDVDRILTIPEAAREVPTGPVAPQSIWRWMALGLLAPNGRRVYLRRLKVGNRFCTTPRLMREFFEEAGNAEPVMGTSSPNQAGGQAYEASPPAAAAVL